MVQSHSFRIGGYRVHSYVDVSQRHQLTVDLQLLADTDPLTGILNRRSFFQQAPSLMRADRPLAALLFDVDHFKLVNDRLGHAFGDHVLVEIVARCRGVLGPTDVLARLGGEEFVVLLPRHDAARAAAMAECLRSAMASAPVKGPLGSSSITISIGGACARPGEFSIDELLLRADNALYAAKRAGRDCVRFDPGAPVDISP
jgi:diguanylate cyclase (GGDEF)-like protein